MEGRGVRCEDRLPQECGGIDEVGDGGLFVTSQTPKHPLLKSRDRELEVIT